MKYWTHSVTLIEGCTPISEGCENCWSATMAWRFGTMPGYVFQDNNDRVKFTGIRIRPDRLSELLKGRKPRVIQIWNDTYHEKVSDNFLYELYSFLLYPPKHIQHTYLILTKRAKRMHSFIEMLCEGMMNKIPDNVWHGVTTENQRTADERIPYLLQVPGKKWLSIEPLLERIEIYRCLKEKSGECKPNGEDFCNGCFHSIPTKNIHQVVVGCETGKHARPCKIEWIESIVEQCKQAGVPCFVKAVNLKGKITSDINKFPESLRVRELSWTRKNTR